MKKFITIALAVAVLFSFAACQPSSFDMATDGNDIAKVTLVDAPTFYEGETYTDLMVKVDVERINGKTTEGLDATLTIGSGAAKTTDTYATVKAYGLDSDGYKVPVTVVGYTLAADYSGIDAGILEITEDEYAAWKGNEQTYLTSNSTAIREKLVVTRAYADGTSSEPIGTTSSVYTLAYNKDYTAIVVKEVSSSKTADIPFSVWQEPVEGPTVTGIDAYYSVNGEEAVATLPALYIGDEVKISIWTVGTEGDKSVKIEDVTSVVRPLGGTSFVTTIDVTDETDCAAAKVAYNGYSTDVSAVTAGQDAIVEVTDIKPTEEGAKLFTADHKFNKGEFEPVFTTLSGETATLASKITIDLSPANQTIPESAKAGDTIYVQLTATYTPHGGTEVTESFIIDVTVVAGSQDGGEEEGGQQT